MNKKIMHFLFLSCLKATELVEKKFHYKLSFQEKIQLKMHKMMCDACTRYEKQSELLEKGIENHLIKNKQDEDKADTEQLKEQIIIKLSKQGH